MTPQEATQELFKAIESGNLSDAKTAIDAGAEVNARNKGQNTPLHWAAEGGQADIARLLIEKEADLNARNEGQNTSLHFAISNGHADIARLLIEKGADLTARNTAQETPLHWAIIFRENRILKMMQDAAKAQHGHAGRVLAKSLGCDEPQIGG